MLRAAVLIYIVCFSVGFAAEQTVLLNVSTMACGPDPHNIKAALMAEAGVTNVEISLEAKTAIVTFDTAKSNLNKLLAAVAGTGNVALPKSTPPVTQ